ncbi:MAG TPA: leucyl/phenylalanyl-tRNA--protein transferase [Euzebyales bacterium]
MSRFPDPRRGPGDGPLAYGGDLEVATLREAYALGIFPWPGDSGTIWWWSPDPRAIIPIGGLHVSRSLRRSLRSGAFSCTSDTAFDAVVAACAHRPGEGTWIAPEMRTAYGRLHASGDAHSVEVWDGAGALVGGLYGVAVGRVFCGESMFHRAPDASKVAMVATMRILEHGGYDMFDVQLPTDHLRSMGAVDLARDAYLDLLAAGLNDPARWDATAAPGGPRPG